MPHIHFDERIAALYDRTSGDRFDPAVLDPTVEFLAEQAAGGRVLEFAVGDVRVALPLARRVADVHGIELSPAMVARLQAKPGADRVRAFEARLAGMTLRDRWAEWLRRPFTGESTSHVSVWELPAHWLWRCLSVGRVTASPSRRLSQGSTSGCSTTPAADLTPAVPTPVLRHDAELQHICVVTHNEVGERRALGQRDGV